MNELVNYTNELKAESMYSFIELEDHDFNNNDLHEIILNNCIIKDVNFKSCSFKSSDIDGTKFFDSEFCDTSFENSDMCSIWVHNCMFKKVHFDFSTITNCTFIKCTFDNCSFEHTALNNCEFNECTIIKLNLKNSSTSLNTFNGTSFEDCNIRGNFYYNLLSSCRNIDSRFDKKLLGYNYFFESDIEICQDEEYSKIYEKFQHNNMLINAAILHLNFTDVFKDKFILTCIKAIEKLIVYDIIIRSEQMQFVKMVLERLIEKKQIAPITIVCAWLFLNQISHHKNTAQQKAIDGANVLKNILYMNYQNFLVSIQDKINASDESKPIVIKIQYNEEPAVRLDKILSDMHVAMGLFSLEQPKRIKTECGSFIEWIQSYDAIINSLQLFVGLLGIGIPIYVDTHKNANKDDNVKKNSDEKAQNNSRDSTLESENISKSILSGLRSFMERELINPNTERHVEISINVIVKNGIINDDNFCGYNNKNIININISYQN